MCQVRQRSHRSSRLRLPSNDDPNNKIIPSTVPENLEGGLFSKDGLAVAMAVDTTTEDKFIYVAIEYDPDSKPPLYKNRRFRMYSSIALVIILCVAVIVVVNITKSTMADEIVSLSVNYTSPLSRHPCPTHLIQSPFLRPHTPNTLPHRRGYEKSKCNG